MSPRLRLGLLLVLPAVLGAQSETDLFDLARTQNLLSGRTDRSPQLEAKRIINESSSFLKEREPEMNAEEYALYEKMVGMLSSNPTFALRLLENMTKEGEQPSPAFQFILGNAYYAAGDFAKTESSYRAAVDRYPAFLRAWNNLGVLYYTTGRFAEAVRAFSRSVALGDREPTTYGLLGYSLEKQGNGAAAEAAYMQALGGDPDNADWQEGLLRLCLQTRQLGRAEGAARNLVKTHPAEPRYWLMLANVLLTDHRKLEALAVLELAAGTSVAGPDELVLLGDLYAEQGLQTEALAIYTKLLKPVPETGEQKLLRLAQVLAAAGRTAEVEKVLHALPAELSPAGRTSRLLLEAQLATEAKRWPDAHHKLDAVLATEPLHGPALLALGTVRLGEGDDAGARLSFEAAVRVPASAYRASLELANLELRQHHYARTVEHLQRALSIERSAAVEDYLDRVRPLAADEPARTP
jgi:tetratricopeptide (TPR) repeat protein